MLGLACSSSEADTLNDSFEEDESSTFPPIQPELEYSTIVRADYTGEGCVCLLGDYCGWWTKTALASDAIAYIVSPFGSCAIIEA